MGMHTPGPWVKDRFGALRGSNGQQVLIADSGIGFASGHERPELQANTALIWAAPELLEALKWALSTLELVLSNKPVRDADECICEAKSVIAKATGGAK